MNPVQPLRNLGFTDLEARIYTELLRESPSSGYQVAKALRKPAANVYKALQTLEGRGAVLVDEGETRLCRAVPAGEFLQRLDRQFQAQKKQAAEALKNLPGPREDVRIYQIGSPEQVMERCRKMLADAEQIVMMDLFPMPLAELRAEIEAATARGIEVVVKVYAPSEISGAEVILEPDHQAVLGRWPGEWVNLVRDGSEFLYALLAKDGRRVIQGVWSESPYLSTILMNSFIFEMSFTALKRDFQRGATRQELQATFEKTQEYLRPDLPGYKRLLKHLGFRHPESQEQ